MVNKSGSWSLNEWQWWFLTCTKMLCKGWMLILFLFLFEPKSHFRFCPVSNIDSWQESTNGRWLGQLVSLHLPVAVFISWSTMLCNDWLMLSMKFFVVQKDTLGFLQLPISIVYSNVPMVNNSDSRFLYACLLSVYPVHYSVVQWMIDCCSSPFLCCLCPKTRFS